jgi:hypothetical protein
MQSDPPAAACQSKAEPAPEPIANAELDPDMLARAAVIAGSCIPDDGIDRNVRHMWDANDANETNALQARCLAEANCGCAAVKECFGYELAAIEPSECAPSCVDGVITGCGGDFDLRDGISVSWDCKKIGRTCSSAAGCADEGAAACDNSLPPSCQDGRPVFCDDGSVRTGPDCTALGLMCEGGRCVGTGADCEGRSGPEALTYVGVACENDALQVCVGGPTGKLALMNCAERGPGFTCQSLMGAAFCGLASECVPAEPGAASVTHPPSCDGTVVTFCNAGRLEHLDCVDLGFTGCELDKSRNLYGCTPGLDIKD